jgi:hypothetical protein
MRIFQQNLEDLSSRISAAETIKNSWQSPNDVAEVGEMLEQLQVRPDACLMQQLNVMVERVASCFVFIVPRPQITCYDRVSWFFSECLQTNDDAVHTLKRHDHFNVFYS